MPGNPRTAGIREFDRLFRQGTLLGRSEAELLDLFVCSRDEYAFEALVTRHGPMVLRTCRALLADPHDADDAFQATFLVLSRRAGSIRHAKLLGPWLHRVARRVCSKSLAESSRRTRLERPSTDALATLAAPGAGLPHADRAALHEAIDLLPERYRRVIILCDLEGHSHAEAAARLRCPIGTVKGRQSRARSLLRRRLTRLGLAPASLLSGTLVSLPTRAFSVPHTLIHRTSRTAAAFALGGSLAPGTVPGVALSLATGVLSGMAAHQLKFTALVGLLALGLGSSGLAALRYADDGDGVPGVVSIPSQPTEGDRPDGRERPDPGNPDTTKAPPLDFEGVADLLGKWRLQSIEGDVLNKDMVPRIDIGPILDLGMPKDGPIPLMVGVHHGAVGHGIGPSFPTSEYPIYLVDPTATPPRIERPTREGRESLPRSRGVYRIEGDRLTLHFVDPDAPHPSGFERTGPDSTRYIYRRINFAGVPGVVTTPAEDAEVAGVVSPPASTEDPLQGRWVVANVFPLNPGDDGSDFRFARGMVLDIKDGRMTPLGLDWGEIEYELRPAGDPKQIDVTYRNDSMWGSNFYRPPTFDERGVEVIENVNRAGIYEFRNPEMLTLYFAEPGGPRPTTMESNVSAGQRSIKLNRLPADPNPRTPPSPDLLDASKSPLLGVWRCIASEGLTGFEEVDLTMEIRADEFPVVRPYYNDEMSLSVTSRASRDLKSGTEPIAIRKSRAFVAPAANPVRIDFLESSDDPEGELPPLRTRGILRLEDDTLTLHLADFDSNTRPSGFERSPDSSTVSLVYRRYDPDEPPAGGAAGAEPTPNRPELLGTWERISMADEPGASPLPLTLELAEVEPWLARNLPAHGIVLRARFASTDSPSLASRGDLAWFDPASDPRRLDLYAYDSTPDGDAIRQTWSGTYSLEADRLTLKLLGPGSPVPSNLDPQPGAIVETYRRLPDRPDAMPQDDPLASVDPVDAELDDLLDRWEGASRDIETLFASFELVDEMTSVGERKVYDATAYLKRPDSVLFQWDKKTNGEASTLAAFDRRILVNEANVVEFDGPARQITVYPLAGDDQKQALGGGTFLSQVPGISRLLDALLPTPTPPAALRFLSCADAEDFKRRYRANLMPSAEEGTRRIAIYPRLAADRNTFTAAVLILDARTLRPRSIHTLAPNGKDKQHYSIKDFKPNVAIDPELFAWDSAKAQQARNDGWRVIVMPEPEPEPEDAEVPRSDTPSRNGTGQRVEADDLLGTWITTSSTLFKPTVINQGEGEPDNTVIQIRRLEGESDLVSDPDDPSIPLRLIWAEQTHTKEGASSPFGAKRDEAIARFDPSSDPPSVTISDGETTHALGIYRLEGDTLILHLGERRPRSWRRDPPNPSKLMTLRRFDFDQILPFVSLDDVRQAMSGNTPSEPRLPLTPEPTPADPTLIEHRLSTLESKLDRLLELLETPDR